MTPLLRQIPRIALLLLLVGCAPVAAAPSGPRPMQLERLYFGRNIGDTAVVSDSAWGVFVREELTPAFPEGSTTWNAVGRWLAPDRSMVHEQTYVVELLHEVTPEFEGRVRRVIDAYKARFAQQAVLRIVTNVQAAF